MNNVIWQNLVLLLLMNMCVRSGGSYFEYLLWQWHLLSALVDSDINILCYQSRNEIDAYQLVSIVSISLLDPTQNS